MRKRHASQYANFGSLPNDQFGFNKSLMVHFYYSPLSIYMYFLSAYYLLILCFFLLTYKGFGDLKGRDEMDNSLYLT